MTPNELDKAAEAVILAAAEVRLAAHAVILDAHSPGRRWQQTGPGARQAVRSGALA